MFYVFCLPPRGCRQNIYLAINQCVAAHGPILYSAPPQGWCGNSCNLSCPLLIRHDKKSRKAHSNPFHYSVNQVIEKLILTNISRATIYNTIILLMDANLVIRHQFGTSSQYERAYRNETHHHMICTECGKVIEFEAELIKQAVAATKLKRFTPSHYSLYVYGICTRCSTAKKRKKRMNNIKSK